MTSAGVRSTVLTRSTGGPLATLVVLCGALALEPGSVQGQAPPEEAREWIEACSTVDDATRVALGDLEESMTDPSAPLSTIEENFEAMLDAPCFDLAGLSEDAGPFASSGVARAWWREGGQDWTSQFVAFGSGRRDEIVLPPSRRLTLALEAAAPDDPLRVLLCPEADESCGRETAGWTIRAERGFEERARAARGQADPPPDCAERVRRRDEGRRYTRFLRCVDDARPPRAAMPVGRMRAPTRGWLVLRGRHGDDRLQDQLSAFDLATGAAYVISAESELVRRMDGTVDDAATDAARRVTTEAGRLSADAVRELAWMLFVSGRVEERFFDATTVPLPSGIPLRSYDDSVFRDLSLRASSTRGSWRLDWVWVDAGRVRLGGDLIWPKDGGAANDHAVHLLRIAEATFAPGCAPARLTALPRLWSTEDTFDSPPDELARTRQALLERLLTVRAPACPRSGR